MAYIQQNKAGWEADKASSTFSAISGLVGLSGEVAGAVMQIYDQKATNEASLALEEMKNGITVDIEKMKSENPSDKWEELGAKIIDNGIGGFMDGDALSGGAKKKMLSSKAVEKLRGSLVTTLQGDKIKQGVTDMQNSTLAWCDLMSSTANPEGVAQRRDSLSMREDEGSYTISQDGESFTFAAKEAGPPEDSDVWPNGKPTDKTGYQFAMDDIEARLNDAFRTDPGKRDQLMQYYRQKTLDFWDDLNFDNALREYVDGGGGNLTKFLDEYVASYSTDGADGAKPDASRLESKSSEWSKRISETKSRNRASAVGMMGDRNGVYYQKMDEWERNPDAVVTEDDVRKAYSETGIDARWCDDLLRSDLAWARKRELHTLQTEYSSMYGKQDKNDADFARIGELKEQMIEKGGIDAWNAFKRGELAAVDNDRLSDLSKQNNRTDGDFYKTFDSWVTNPDMEVTEEDALNLLERSGIKREDDPELYDHVIKTARTRERHTLELEYKGLYGDGAESDEKQASLADMKERYVKRYGQDAWDEFEKNGVVPIDKEISATQKLLNESKYYEDSRIVARADHFGEYDASILDGREDDVYKEAERMVEEEHGGDEGFALEQDENSDLYQSWLDESLPSAQMAVASKVVSEKRDGLAQLGLSIGESKSRIDTTVSEETKNEETNRKIASEGFLHPVYSDESAVGAITSAMKDFAKYDVSEISTLIRAFESEGKLSESDVKSFRNDLKDGGKVRMEKYGNPSIQSALDSIKDELGRFFKNDSMRVALFMPDVEKKFIASFSDIGITNYTAQQIHQKAASFMGEYMKDFVVKDFSSFLTWAKKDNFLNSDGKTWYDDLTNGKLTNMNITFLNDVLDDEYGLGSMELFGKDGNNYAQYLVLKKLGFAVGGLDYTKGDFDTKFKDFVQDNCTNAEASLVSMYCGLLQSAVRFNSEFDEFCSFTGMEPKSFSFTNTGIVYRTANGIELSYGKNANGNYELNYSLPYRGDKNVMVTSSANLIGADNVDRISHLLTKQIEKEYRELPYGVKRNMTAYQLETDRFDHLATVKALRYLEDNGELPTYADEIPALRELGTYLGTVDDLNTIGDNQIRKRSFTTSWAQFQKKGAFKSNCISVSLK